MVPFRYDNQLKLKKGIQVYDCTNQNYDSAKGSHSWKTNAMFPVWLTEGTLQDSHPRPATPYFQWCNIPIFLKVRARVSIVIKGTQNIDKIVQILIIQWMVLIGKRVVILIWDSFDLSFIDYLFAVATNKQAFEQTLTHWLIKMSHMIWLIS